jgi:hypothetical protein
MWGIITLRIRDFLIDHGPATSERVAEAVPELTENGAAERALLLMRLDPNLERTTSNMWAARGTAITDDRRVRKAAENFFAGRPGVPLTSATKTIAEQTGLTQQRVEELLRKRYQVIGPNLFNRTSSKGDVA